MKARNRPRFDVAALRELAGDKTFARGEAYHRNGQVQILTLQPRRVAAQVAGTDDYRTVLTGRGAEIDGKCSCPAFEEWGFCKHMVAVALAANAAGQDGEAEGAGALARIRDHLKAKGADALVDMILDLAEGDPDLFHRLDMAAAVLHADDKTLEVRLGKAIDRATHHRGFIDYRAAPAWAAGVDQVLGAIAELLSGGRAGLALKLADRAIDRIEETFEAIDDSDGHLGALLRRARDIHLAAAGMARPEPLQLARYLFARETKSDFDSFEGASELYADVLGETGLSEFRRLATEAWDKLPPRSGKARNSDDFDGDYHRLMPILDVFAAVDGDLDARVALRAKYLSSPWNYLQLAEFCLAQGRKEEALRRAEEGLWLFEDDRQDLRLLLFVVERLAKAGRKDDAEVHLRRAFDKAPSLELYAWLRKLGGKAAADWAQKLVESRLDGSKPNRWNSPADLLIHILMQEKNYAAAWAAVGTHGASSGTKEALAEASEKKHPREALAVHGEHVEQLALVGGDHAYAEAVKLVTRMAKLRSAAEQRAHVTALKERFKRRRNFVKLLG